MAIRILTAPASFEVVIKNSRFLTEATYVDTQDAAREIIRQKKNQWPDITHIVHAFAVGQNANILGCSDDGEPAGTAGRPTLEVLKGSGLTNVILTTARWFGGTKLGTGGLVKAYTECAQGCLANAVTQDLIAMATVSFSIQYPIYESCRLMLQELEFKTDSEVFLDSVTITGSLREERVDILADRLRDMSRGKATLIRPEE